MDEFDISTDQLPSDLVVRLRELASTQTVGSSPWPNLERVIRQDRRRRRLGAGAAAVALVVVGALLTGLLQSPAPHSQPAIPASKSRAAELSALRNAGWDGPVSGSLAHDDTWLNGLRNQVVKTSRTAPPEQTGLRSQDVLVQWAGDVEGSRYALVLYPLAASPDSEASFMIMVLAGPAGADAKHLSLRTAQPAPEPTKTLTRAIIDYEAAVEASAPHQTLLLVSGPQVTSVKVGTARHFASDGSTSTTWRELRPDSGGGSTWMSGLNDLEHSIHEVAVSGVRRPLDIGPTSMPLIDTVKAIAPPGTNTDVLSQASTALQSLGASLSEQPRIATTVRLSRQLQLGASVVQSPDGPYIVGFSVAQMQPDGATVDASIELGHVFTSTAQPDRLMAVVQTDPFVLSMTDFKNGPRYLVLAPVGATQVRIGTKVAQVNHRLAAFGPDAGPGQVTIQALDVHGKVLATTRSVHGK